jgi:Domain of unknown function (DUF4349)
MKLTDEQIATELHALRPTPSDEFAAELDAWAAAGFPAASERASEPPRRRWWRRNGPRLGMVLAPVTAMALLVGLVATVGTLGTDEDDGGGTSLESVQPDSGAGVGGEARREPAPTDEAIEPATAAPLPGRPDQQLKPGQERIQEQTVSTTLSTEPGEVDDVADGVVEVTERFDGIVVSSSVSTNADRGRANFDLRVPTQNLQAFLADLSDLASVSERNEGVRDITAPFITAEERFDDAKAEVDALLAQLAEADTTTEIDAIKQRLAPARAELAGARSALADLKRRADYSTVSVSVVGDGDSDGWSLGDAADDAWNVFEDITGAGLIALAVIVPLGAIAILGALGMKQVRRRQREGALDD